MAEKNQKEQILMLMQSLARKRGEVLKQLAANEQKLDEASAKYLSLQNRKGIARLFTPDYENKLSAAQKAYESACERSQKLTSEVERIAAEEKEASARLREQAKIDHAQKQNLQKAEELILALPGEKRDRLLKLNGLLHSLSRHRARLEKAMDSAQKAYDASFYAYDNIDSANKLAKYDARIVKAADSPLLDIAKHQKLDKGQTGVLAAEVYLQDLADKLRDIQNNIGTELSGSIKIRDIWLDDIFINRTVRDIIEYKKYEIISLREKIRELMQTLERDREETEKQIKTIAVQKENLCTTADE